MSGFRLKGISRKIVLMSILTAVIISIIIGSVSVYEIRKSGKIINSITLSPQRIKMTISHNQILKDFLLILPLEAQ